MFLRSLESEFGSLIGLSGSGFAVRREVAMNLRVDLPTIGLDTVKNCIKANIKGIAVKRSQNIILNKDKIINI